jgi:hypothetical protein
MTLKAYIKVGHSQNAPIVPILLPDAKMREIAGQIGIPESDLFSVSVPVGMTRHTRISCLVASTQIATVFSHDKVHLFLEDSSGRQIEIKDLYVRPPQPFLWRQSGGPVLLELVDERWYWRYSAAALTGSQFSFMWSSDGRWQLDSVTSYDDLLLAIDSWATANNLQMPAHFTAPATPYIRRLSDLIGSPTVSLATILDAIAVATRQIIVADGEHVRFRLRDDLQSKYDAAMNAYRLAICGGGQATNDPAGGTDPMVNLWSQYGYTHRAPASCSVVLPNRSIEGLTVYDNCSELVTPATQENFPYSFLYTAGDIPTWPRAPLDKGQGFIPDAAVVCSGADGSTLTTFPGWNPVALAASIRTDYLERYTKIPFGRTVWAGWLPSYKPQHGQTPEQNLGQIGCVTYRIAEIDGEMSPFTVSECDQSDWRFGLSGEAWSEPSQIVTAKGKAQAYRNCVGATIIDVPPPNTRVFPARITGATELAPWKWRYTFTEVEPQVPPETDPAPSASMGAYARTGHARNMAEGGNTYLGASNPGNVIAPGVYQNDYANADIEAEPISTGTIVEMVEQFRTARTDPPMTAAEGPAFWFSMPNAVRVVCVQP